MNTPAFLSFPLSSVSFQNYNLFSFALSSKGQLFKHLKKSQKKFESKCINLVPSTLFFLANQAPLSQRSLLNNKISHIQSKNKRAKSGSPKLCSYIQGEMIAQNAKLKKKRIKASGFSGSLQNTSRKISQFILSVTIRSLLASLAYEYGGITGFATYKVSEILFDYYQKNIPSLQNHLKHTFEMMILARYGFQGLTALKAHQITRDLLFQDVKSLVRDLSTFFSTDPLSLSAARSSEEFYLWLKLLAAFKGEIKNSAIQYISHSYHEAIKWIDIPENFMQPIFESALRSSLMPYSFFIYFD